MLRPQPECSTIYLYRKPVDIRKAINGLVAIVEGQMSLDPFSSGLFVFCNSNRSIVNLNETIIRLPSADSTAR